MTSRYVEIRPDNVPADGVVSFKNGFPVLSFTISAQEGLLDPASIRIVGDVNVYSDNATPKPTPALPGDKLTMNNRLGIYNIFDSLTIRAHRSKMICEQIRHYQKWFNSYTALTSSLSDQTGHMGETTLQMPNPDAFRQSVVENNVDGTQTTSFSAHLPCGFCQSGNMVDLRPDAFGGVQVEIMLMPDANVLYFEDGVVPAGKGEAHYRLKDLKLCCEVQTLPSDMKQAPASGSFEFNTITSLYTSINSTNAQIQYSLALKNLQSAFLTFMPVRNINTLTADGSTTTYPSLADSELAPIERVQFLKGGSKYPAEFDYVNNFAGDANTQLPDPQIVKGLYDAIVPSFSQVRSSISVDNMSRDYNLGTTALSSSYSQLPLGGAVMGLGVKYGIGDAGDDFSNQQFGVSIESKLTSDNPIGVYLFFKSKATLLYSQQGVQLIQ
tara:strand:+ start:97 stop:1416 length:1320 start_codon:yes stop_codon:yes gene_type:complete